MKHIYLNLKRFDVPTRMAESTDRTGGGLGRVHRKEYPGRAEKVRSCRSGVRYVFSGGTSVKCSESADQKEALSRLAARAYTGLILL